MCVQNFRETARVMRISSDAVAGRWFEQLKSDISAAIEVHEDKLEHMQRAAKVFSSRQVRSDDMETFELELRRGLTVLRQALKSVSIVRGSSSRYFMHAGETSLAHETL